MFVSEREFTLEQIKDMKVGDVKEIKIKKGGTIKVARSYMCAFFSKKSLCTVTNKTTDGNLILQVLKRDDVTTKKDLIQKQIKAKKLGDIFEIILEENISFEHARCAIVDFFRNNKELKGQSKKIGEKLFVRIIKR